MRALLAPAQPLVRELTQLSYAPDFPELFAHPMAASTTMCVMSKSQDAKKNVKKAPTRTPKEKKELKRLKKAGK